MNKSFLVRYSLVVLSFFILSAAVAKPKVRPYSQRVNGDRYVGVKMTWTFLAESKKSNTLDSASPSSKSGQIKRSQIEFNSLEAALSDPRVSSSDKLLIKNSYIPKLNRFNAELKKLNLEAAVKLSNGKPAIDDATLIRKFNGLMDQHAVGVSIQKLSPNASRE